MREIERNAKIRFSLDKEYFAALAQEMDRAEYAKENKFYSYRKKQIVRRP